MIVVINPSASNGHSFKGLHAYCAHDQDRAETAERVDWIETRNLASDDPEHAWKIMAATAAAQNNLKQASGIRAGQPPKDGAVTHLVMSFDRDEPTDRETIQKAADGLLSVIGADPAKMRGKSKPKRRQFADEHQVIMYTHSDTDNVHVHMMINRVHPETGLLLPDSNNYDKAQKWALKFSKAQGTDHKTPAREENREMRENGEYVKADPRKSRNVFEQEQAMKSAAANQNDRVHSVKLEQGKKDAALALRGRNMAKLHDVQWNKLIDGHKQRKASIDKQLNKAIRKAKVQIREEYRHKRRDLKKLQASELKTFEALENSLFGKASNVVKTVRLSAADISNDRSSVISRSFRILSNSGTRKEYFENAQKRQLKALESDQTKTVVERTEALKSEYALKYERNRATFTAQRSDLTKFQEVDKQKLQNDWKQRTAERKSVYDKIAEPVRYQKSPSADGGRIKMTEEYYRDLGKILDASDDYNEMQEAAKEQDNDQDQGQER
jgi:hypothetical protein